jgi:hypothetical protein
METNKTKIGQQANFNSLIQVIGLRANFTWRNDPKQLSGTLPDPFDGRATYWEWYFETEREDSYNDGVNPTGLLHTDLQGVPIVALLNNSVDIDPAVFKTQGDNVNIWVDEINTL